jgi:hypothetical protein
MRVSIAKAIREKWLVTVHRSVEGTNHEDGFVLQASKQWLLIQSANALRLDGFWIFRRDTVLSLQLTAFVDFKLRMMRREGLLNFTPVVPEVDITSARGILASLQKSKRLVILFRENEEEWWKMHCAIRTAFPAKLRLHPFDGAGRWGRAIPRSRWTLEAITAVRFGSHYLGMYEKFAREPRSKTVQA